MKHVLTFALCMGFLSFVQAQTVVAPGEVSGIWTKSNSPYQITGNIYIQNDSTLTIEPGVKVEFQGHFELKVMGRLLAEGSTSDTIRFTVNDTTGFFNQDAATGGWYGIRIYDISPDNDSTKLAFCKLEYGKAIGPGWYYDSGGALCVIDFDKVSVSNCKFINNMACGPDEESPSGGAVYFEFSDIEFSDNTFIQNTAHSGGALFFFESDPKFRNNLFMHNQSTWAGGALSGGGISFPSFSGDVFQNNQSAEMGGAMLFGGPVEVVMDQVSATQNGAIWAGGLGFLGCVVHIENSSISDNLALGLGGGIAADGSSLYITDTEFDGDSATQKAGAIHSWMGSLELKEVSFSDNKSGLGGAIHADWSSVVMDSSDFLSNEATTGGALKIFNSHLSMKHCLLKGNMAMEDGGGLDFAVDTLVFDTLFVAQILHSRFENNRAGRAAGGFSIQQTHSRYSMLELLIDQCEISDNRAHQVGGFRIMRCLHPLVFSNSIIQGNRVAAWTGGGSIAAESLGHVYNCLFYNNHSDTLNNGSTSGALGVGNQAKVDVMHSTFAGNSAGRGGGMQVHRGGEAIVTNSIFWENIPQQLALTAPIDTLPCRLTLNYNDIQYGLDSIMITDTVSSVIFGVGNLDKAPQFADEDLADFHLLETSPLIGAATDSLEIEGNWYLIPISDLDGNPRPAPAGSQPDMGAYENDRNWPLGFDQKLVVGDNGFYVRCFPNPFTASIILELILPEKALVRVEVFNLLGELVFVSETADLYQGGHRITWSPPDGENHLFFYRVSMQPFSGPVRICTGRMIRIL